MAVAVTTKHSSVTRVVEMMERETALLLTA
jgi:hypothetical protein